MLLFVLGLLVVAQCHGQVFDSVASSPCIISSQQTFHPRPDTRPSPILGARRGSVRAHSHLPRDLKMYGRVDLVMGMSRSLWTQKTAPLDAKYASLSPSCKAGASSPTSICFAPLAASTSYTLAGGVGGRVAVWFWSPCVFEQSHAEGRGGGSLPSARAFASTCSQLRMVLLVSPWRQSLVLRSVSTSTSSPSLFKWLNAATRSDCVRCHLVMPTRSHVAIPVLCESLITMRPPVCRSGNSASDSRYYKCDTSDNAWERQRQQNCIWNEVLTRLIQVYQAVRRRGNCIRNQVAIEKEWRHAQQSVRKLLLSTQGTSVEVCFFSLHAIGEGVTKWPKLGFELIHLPHSTFESMYRSVFDEDGNVPTVQMPTLQPPDT